MNKYHLKPTDLHLAIQRESQIRQFFNSLFEATPNGIWITDNNGFCILANKACVDYTGLLLEDLYLFNVNPVMKKNGIDQDWKLWLKEVLNGKEIQKERISLVSAKKQEQIFLLSLIPISYQGQTYAMGQIENITERENLKKEVNEVAWTLKKLHKTIANPKLTIEKKTNALITLTGHFLKAEIGEITPIIKKGNPSTDLDQPVKPASPLEEFLSLTLPIIYFDSKQKEENWKKKKGLKEISSTIFFKNLPIGKLSFFINKKNTASFSPAKKEIPQLVANWLGTEIQRLALEKEKIGTIFKVQNQERKRIAQDLHDGVSPLLSIIKMTLDVASDKKIKKEADPLINNAIDLLNTAIEELKNSIHDLQSQQLHNNNLQKNLKELCQKINATGQVEIVLDSSIEKFQFSKKMEVQIFTILKELLNNTIKHANASRISIILEEHGGVLKIEYSDDGKGLKNLSSDLGKGLGLKGVINRIGEINGEYKFQSPPTLKGFNLIANIPITSE